MSLTPSEVNDVLIRYDHTPGTGPAPGVTWEQYHAAVTPTEGGEQ